MSNNCRDSGVAQHDVRTATMLDAVTAVGQVDSQFAGRPAAWK